MTVIISSSLSSRRFSGECRQEKKWTGKFFDHESRCFSTERMCSAPDKGMSFSEFLRVFFFLKWPLWCTCVIAIHQKAVEFLRMVLWCFCHHLRSFVSVHSEKKGALCSNSYCNHLLLQTNLYKSAIMSVCDAVRKKDWRLCYLNSEHFSLTWMNVAVYFWALSFLSFRVCYPKQWHLPCEATKEARSGTGHHHQLWVFGSFSSTHINP